MAEMRSKRTTKLGKLPRVYLPWDPLQLDGRIDSGLRVKKASVLFRLYKTYRKTLYWAPLFHKNLGVFYSEREDCEAFLLSLTDQMARNFSGSLTIELYDFTNEWQAFGLEQDDTHNSFRYHPYEESFAHFLEELLSFRATVEETALKAGMVEGGNKRLQLITFPVGDAEAALLKSDKKVRKNFADLLKRSERARFFLLPLFTTTTVPEVFVKALDVAIFLGEDKEEWAREEVFTTLEEGVESYYQKRVGLMHHRDFEGLQVLHTLKFTPTDYAETLEVEGAKEEELYRKFLESLKE